MFPRLRLQRLRQRQANSRLSKLGWELYCLFSGLFGPRESMVEQQHEIDGVFNRFCQGASFLLDGTMEAFLERAAPIKAGIEKKVTEITETIVRLERESVELNWRPGDDVERELNRRESSNRSSTAGGFKYDRNDVLYGDFKQQLERLQRSMRADENRFVAQKGLLVYQSYSLSKGWAFVRKVVLWADGRHFLISYSPINRPYDKIDIDDAKLFELANSDRVQWTTDSLFQFNKAELQAIEDFNKGFVPTALATT